MLEIKHRCKVSTLLAVSLLWLPLTQGLKNKHKPLYCSLCYKQTYPFFLPINSNGYFRAQFLYGLKKLLPALQILSAGYISLDILIRKVIICLMHIFFTKLKFQEGTNHFLFTVPSPFAKQQSNKTSHSLLSSLRSSQGPRTYFKASST